MSFALCILVTNIASWLMAAFAVYLVIDSSSLDDPNNRLAVINIMNSLWAAHFAIALISEASCEAAGIFLLSGVIVGTVDVLITAE